MRGRYFFAVGADRALEPAPQGVVRPQDSPLTLYADRDPHAEKTNPLGAKGK